ncbi:cytochrome P450 [Streptomyces radicis]|uniref:Cytochrome P450 n=1 Tax=Streptomyces radicis TaxID=1750517 RepID=A0A3A9WCJ7_9ACTN|nr:cytochrome P450 [Streptomyces radicis]RKN24768.1 cytochrome P450 [Streptomyces radicis]
MIGRARGDTPVVQANGPLHRCGAAAHDDGSLGVEPSETVFTCPFDFADGLEFDPLLRQLMTEAPIARIRMSYGQGEAWLVTRFEDVRVVTSDRRFSRAAVAGRDFPRMTPAPIVQDESINLLDPPESSRLRRLVSQAFTAPKVDAMRPATQRIVDELIDGMAEQGPPADLVKHLSSQLPLTTICEVLEIPDADRPELRARAVAMMNVGATTREAAVRAKAELRAYFADLTARRRAEPGDDLISSLATARDGDEVLGTDELTVMAMVLLMTGHDTSTYQLSNITYTLLTHPEQREKLRATPELLPRALEELLRYIPFRKGVGIPRIATEDVELGGVTIRKNDTVHVSYLAANRDPARFEHPDELDLDRPTAPHMTFGWGAHHCIGAPLALMELELAIGTLLRRFPGLALAVPASEVRWNDESIWRYPYELPVTW